MLQESAHEDDDDQVRRLHHATGSGRASGLDRRQAERAAAARLHAAEAPESLVERLFLHVVGMRILAVRVGLPSLNHGIVDRLAVAIEHAAADRHTLAIDADGRNLGDLRVLENNRAERPYRLRSRHEQAHLNAPSAWRRARAARYRSGSRARIRAPCSPSRTRRSGAGGHARQARSCTSDRIRAADRPENTSA